MSRHRIIMTVGILVVLLTATQIYWLATNQRHGDQDDTKAEFRSSAAARLPEGSKLRGLKKINQISLDEVLKSLPAAPLELENSYDQMLREHALYRKLGELMGEDALAYVLERYPTYYCHQMIFGFILEGIAKKDPNAAAAALRELIETCDKGDGPMWRGKQIGNGIGYGGIFGYDMRFHRMIDQAIYAITSRDPTISYALLSSGLFSEDYNPHVEVYIHALPAHSDWNGVLQRLKKDFPTEESFVADVAGTWARHDMDTALAWLSEQSATESEGNYGSDFLDVSHLLETTSYSETVQWFGPGKEETKLNSAALLQWMERNYGTKFFDDELLPRYAASILSRNGVRNLDETRDRIINMSANENTRYAMLMEIVNYGTPQSQNHKNTHPSSDPSIDDLRELTRRTNLSLARRQEALERIKEIEARRASESRP